MSCTFHPQRAVKSCHVNCTNAHLSLYKLISPHYVVSLMTNTSPKNRISLEQILQDCISTLCMCAAVRCCAL